MTLSTNVSLSDFIHFWQRDLKSLQVAIVSQRGITLVNPGVLAGVCYPKTTSASL